MQFLYPSDPFSKNEPDEAYLEEFQAMKSAGLNCVLFSSEDAAEGKFRARPQLDLDDKCVVYRGWMLNVYDYNRFYDQVAAAGGELLTNPSAYVFCHYLPLWYPLCMDETPSTISFMKEEDFDDALRKTGWSAYFVKDYVKSLTTSRGSVAKNIDEVHDIVKLLAKYRGELEGGLCVREYEELLTDTEERYFVWQGRAYGREGAVPDMVQDVAKRIDSAFFTIDVAQRRDGLLRLIEIGDGQVSDRKQWTAEQFADIFTN